ncbi:MAG TPA: hypothetical protein VFQ61_01075 [Polyangiaceae bacterium]|nr:hypothetical protein [Polyangiaceae bacterium]
MPFAWILNLDAELELSQPRYQASAAIRRRLEEHAQRAQGLLGAGDITIDVLEANASMDASAFKARAWCPTRSAQARAAARGIELEPAPELSIIERVNHRLFAHQLGGGLPGQRYVTQPAELDEVLAGAQWPLLFKRPFSFAGRGQQRLYRAPTAPEAAWLAASIRTGGMIVEPLVQPIVEFSQHGWIEAHGQTRYGAPCVQSVSDRGVFQAARRATSADLRVHEQHALTERLDAVAVALRRAGYFGPFGIDAYRYDSRGRVGFCALSEINARYTLSYPTGFSRA